MSLTEFDSTRVARLFPYLENAIHGHFQIFLHVFANNVTGRSARYERVGVVKAADVYRTGRWCTV